MTRTSDPYEALASLFLTDASERANRDADARSTAVRRTTEEAGPSDRAALPDATLAPQVEIALVGHLPVMGGLWLTQYADQVARSDGPTALIRLERGQATVELLRSPGQRAGLDAAETLDEAIHILAERAHRWIVCPQGESAMDGPLPADRLTLLTGSDDAATVAAYRIVKSLAERWHASGWPMPAIGLVVLGAPRERVGEVAEKLDRTTKAFLDVDLSVVGQFQRMDAIESAGRKTFPGVEPTLADVARRIEAAVDRVRRIDERRVASRPAPRAIPFPRAAQASTPITSAAARPSPYGTSHGPRASLEAATESDLRLPPEGEPVRADGPESSSAAARTPAPSVEPARIREPRLRERLNHAVDDALDSLLESVAEGSVAASLATAEPRSGRGEAPAGQPAREGAAAPTIGPLAAHLPGLDALPVRCPAHPSVELAVDATGSLHLVVPSEAVVDLRPTEAWARAHWDLLRLACPRLAGDCPEPLVGHVVTTHAPGVVALYGTDLVLHLLVASPSGWIHAPLS